MLFDSDRSIHAGKSTDCSAVAGAIHSDKRKNRTTPKHKDNSRIICYNNMVYGTKEEEHASVEQI
jgi:hypothetical protein